MYQNFVNTVSADILAPNGAKPSADRKIYTLVETIMESPSIKDIFF